MLAPLNCWISIMDLPAGPRTAPIKLSLTSMSTLARCSSIPGGGGGGRGFPAVASPKELLLTGSGGNWLLLICDMLASGDTRAGPGEAGRGGKGPTVTGGVAAEAERDGGKQEALKKYN